MNGIKLETCSFKEGLIESPIVVQLEVLWRCNHRCIFCYNYMRDGLDVHVEPSLAKIKKIIAKISQAGIFSLVVTGGEPCLRRDFHEILDLAHPRFQNILVNTNGSVLNKKFLKAMKKNNAVLLISLHAPDQETYRQITRSRDFSRVISNMRELRKNEITFGVNFVATKLNFRKFFETAVLAKQLGAKVISIGRFVEPMYMTPEQVSRLQLNAKETSLLHGDCLKVEHKLGVEVAVVTPFPFCAPKSPHSRFIGSYSCQAGLTVCAVSPTGEVRPCQSFGLSFGNIFDKSLKEIWSKMHKKFKSLNTIECRECVARAFCRAGCRAAAYHTYKRLDAPDSLRRKVSEGYLKKLVDTFKEHVKTLKHEKIEDRLRVMGLDPFRTKLAINENATFRREEGALIVYLHPFTIQLNKTAKEIFLLLKRRQMTMQELADKISIKYQVDAQVVLKDVTEALNSMGNIVLQAHW